MKETSPATGSRLLSLDIFRGMTIAGMIVVNTPGNSSVYTQLEHSPWNGCTMADLVFPFFLFIVGVSVVFSLSKRLDNADESGVLGKVLRRTAILFALGMLLNAVPNYHPSTIRIPGVLQRIALCYGAAAILFWKTSLRTQAAIAAAALIGYWLAITYIPVPGWGAGVLTREGSLASFVDRWLLGSHIYRQGNFDPEGLLSTIPAVATTLLGMFSGIWLKSGRTAKEKLKGMTAAGMACLLAGWTWSFWSPLNKSLWTSSYALYTGGLALWFLSFCYWVADIKGYVAWGKPFAVLGRNAIAAYVWPILLLKFTLLWHVAGTDGTPQQLKVYLCEHMFGSWLSPTSASAAYALTYMLVWLGFFSTLERKGIHMKV